MKQGNKKHFIYVFVIFTTLALLMGGMFSVRSQVGGENAIAASFVRNYYQYSAGLATGGAISADGIQALSDQGVKTIIDLRQPEEGVEAERKEAQEKGLTYINIPIGRDGVQPEHVEEFSKAYEEARKRGAILLHCASGNRVGGLWTAYQLKQKIEPEKAFKEGRAIGMGKSLEETIKKRFCQSC